MAKLQIIVTVGAALIVVGAVGAAQLDFVGDPPTDYFQNQAPTETSEPKATSAGSPGPSLTPSPSPNPTLNPAEQPSPTPSPTNDAQSKPIEWRSCDEVAVHGTFSFVSVTVTTWAFDLPHGFYLDNGYDEPGAVRGTHVTTTERWEDQGVKSDYWVAEAGVEYPNGTTVVEDNPNAGACDWQSRQHAEQVFDTGGNTSTDWKSCTEAVVTTDYPEMKVQLLAPGDSVVFTEPVENGQAHVTLEDAGQGVEHGEGWYIESISPIAYDGTFGEHQYNPDAESCSQQGSGPNKQHTLEIVPNGDETQYRIEVTGELQEGNVNGRDINPDDSISENGQVAEGHIAPGFQGDSYVFTGEIVRIVAKEGSAEFVIDGENNN